MDLVVDANIFFSALIRSGKTEDLFFEPSLHLFVPEFIFEEFAKYKELIIRKTNRTESEFDYFLEILKKRVDIIPNEETEKFIAKAKLVCPDEKDVDYFAIAMKLNCALWSNDKELKNQQSVTIYSTSELLNLIF
jgi:predicted nucleic acid-binding protein